MPCPRTLHHDRRDWLVFNAVFNNFSIISRVVSCLSYKYSWSIYPDTIDPAILSPKESCHYCHFWSLWYHPAGDRFSIILHTYYCFSFCPYLRNKNTCSRDCNYILTMYFVLQYFQKLNANGKELTCQSQFPQQSFKQNLLAVNLISLINFQTNPSL